MIICVYLSIYLSLSLSLPLSLYIYIYIYIMYYIYIYIYIYIYMYEADPPKCRTNWLRSSTSLSTILARIAGKALCNVM